MLRQSLVGNGWDQQKRCIVGFPCWPDAVNRLTLSLYTRPNQHTQAPEPQEVSPSPPSTLPPPPSSSVRVEHARALSECAQGHLMKPRQREVGGNLRATLSVCAQGHLMKRPRQSRSQVAAYLPPCPTLRFELEWGPWTREDAYLVG